MKENLHVTRYPFHYGDLIIYTGHNKQLKQFLGGKAFRFVGAFDEHTQAQNPGTGEVSLLDRANVEYRIKESQLANFRKATDTERG